MSLIVSICVRSLSQMNFDITWYFNDNGCWNRTQGTRILGEVGLELDNYQLVNLHLVTFAGLVAVGLLELIFSLLQVLAGICGCVCGTNKTSDPLLLPSCGTIVLVHLVSSPHQPVTEIS